jgi:hypothetical protein
MCILSLLFVVYAFAMLKILPRRIRNTTWRSTGVYLIGWLVIILGSVACIRQGFLASNIAVDLSQPSFVTYTGKLDWKEQTGKSAMDVALLSDDSITVISFGDTHDLSNGTYTGEVIYTSHSKIIVEMDVEPQT